MDYQKEINNRLEAIKNFLQFEPIKSETELAEIMTLGDMWDVPEVIIQALDQHPQFEARYIGLRRSLEIAKIASEQKMKFFEAQTKEVITETIFKENVASGMTPNNANPTGTKINNKYLIDVVEGDVVFEPAKTYSELVCELEKTTEAYIQARIITDALKSRATLLASMASLIGRMIDSNLVIMDTSGKKKRNKVTDEDGFK